jgi:hypothetical protein
MIASLIAIITSLERAGGVRALFPFLHIKHDTILDGAGLVVLRLVSLILKC